MPPPWVPETVAKDSADAGSLASEMSPEEANTDWAPVLRSVLDLARSSMPTMENVKSINAYTKFNPNVLQECEEWAASVSQSFGRLRATCMGIAERFEGDAQYEQYEQLREELAQYSRSLATMRVAYEYLASMSTIVQRNTIFVQQRWQSRLAPRRPATLPQDIAGSP